MPNLTQIPITHALLRGVVELEETPRGLLPHRLPHDETTVLVATGQRCVGRGA